MASAVARVISIVMAAVVFLAPLVASNLEGDVLYAFRQVLTDPNNNLQSWDPTLVDPCTWTHIICNQDNQVIRVEIGLLKLSGHLIPELGQLEHLQSLLLYGNDIRGTIPAEFGNMKSLVGLDLYNNKITGSIPPSLGKLKSLQFLRLYNNQLTGRIPTELTQIPNLRVCDLSTNDLCGDIPSTGPFANFPPKFFENNPRLGHPC